MVYEYLWRNKWLTFEATTIGEMATLLEAAARHLREMEAAGVTLLVSEGIADDYAFLHTEDPEVAARFDMEPQVSDEDECEDNEWDEDPEAEPVDE